MKDKNGNVKYPVTVTSAVFHNGIPLSDLIVSGNFGNGNNNNGGNGNPDNGNGNNNGGTGNGGNGDAGGNNNNPGGGNGGSGNGNGNTGGDHNCDCNGECGHGNGGGSNPDGGTGPSQPTQKNFTVNLTRISSYVPLDKNGNVVGNLDNVYTEVQCFYGLEDVTAESSIRVTKSYMCVPEVRMVDNKPRIAIVSLTVTKGLNGALVSESYVEFEAEYNGAKVKKLFSIIKLKNSSDSNPGNGNDFTPGDGENGGDGDTFTLTVEGGTRSVVYSQLSVKPRPSVSQEFSVSLYKNGEKIDDSQLTFQWRAAGHLYGTSNIKTFTPAIKPAFEEELTANDIAVRVIYDGKGFLYYIPISITRDADGLDWVKDWDGTATVIHGTKVLTPKLFAGTKHEDGTYSGVAVGCDPLNDGETIGIVGYEHDKASFLLDVDGSVTIGRPYDENGVGIHYRDGNLVAKVTSLTLEGQKIPSQDDINNSIGSAIEDYKTQVDTVIGTVQNSIAKLEDLVNDSFDDTVLNGVEKSQIEATFNVLKLDYIAVNKQVETILENVNLKDGIVKEVLQGNFESYKEAFKELEKVVTEVLAVEGIIPVVLMTKFNVALKAFSDATATVKLSINEAIQEINKHIVEGLVGNAREEINTQINDVGNALNSLEEIMNGDFKDGVLSEAQTQVIKERIATINAEMADILALHQLLDASQYLDGAMKVQLHSLKTTLVEAQTALNDLVNNAISDSFFTADEVQAIRAQIDVFQDALKAYNVYAQECNVEIVKAIAKNEIANISDEDIFNKLTSYGTKQGLFINDGHLYINGQWVQTKNLKSVNNDGETTFFVNSDGDVEINAKKLTIAGKTTVTSDDLGTINNTLQSIKSDVSGLRDVVNGSLSDTVLNGTEKAKIEAAFIALKSNYQITLETAKRLETNENLLNKDDLVNKKNICIGKFTALEKKVEELLEMEGVIPAEKLAEFNAAVDGFGDAITALKLAIDDALAAINDKILMDQINNAKNEVSNEISDVSDALNSLDILMKGAFKDGLISQAESIAIKERISIINSEMEDVNAQFLVLNTNTYLSPDMKTELVTLKGKLDEAVDALNILVEEAIDDMKFTSEELDNIRVAIIAHRAALTAYGAFAERCAIDIAINIAQSKVDSITDEDIYNKLTAFGTKQGIFITENGQVFFNGQYVNAKNLSVTNKNNVKTLEIDANGNVSINASSLSIGSSKVVTGNSVQDTVDKSLAAYKEEVDNAFTGMRDSISNLEGIVGGQLNDVVLNGTDKAKIEGAFMALKLEYETTLVQIDNLLARTELQNSAEKIDLDAKRTSYINAFAEVKKKVDELLAAEGIIPGEKMVQFNKTLSNLSTASVAVKDAYNKACEYIYKITATNIANAAAAAVSSQVADVSKNLEALDTLMKGDFKDQLLSKSQTQVILERVAAINAEMDDVLVQYNGMYSSNFLSADKKSQLSTAKNNLVSAHSALKTAITMANQDSIFTGDEIANIRSLISAYATKLSAYNLKAQECSVEIALAIANNAVANISDQDIFNKLTTYGVKQGLFIKSDKVYVNGQFIQTRNLKAVNTKGDTTFFVDADGNVTLRPTTFMLMAGTNTNVALSSDVTNQVSGLQSQINNKINSTQAESIAQGKVDAITAQTMFNKVFDHAKKQGMYTDSNGKLYLNGEYVNAKNLVATNSSGQQTFKVDAAGNVSISPTTFNLMPNANTNVALSSNVTSQVNNLQNQINNKIDANQAGSIAQGKVDAITAKTMFDKVFSHGKTQGMYTDTNGKLYLNGEYINAKNLSVRNSSNADTFKVDSSGNVTINATKLTIGSNSVATDTSVTNKISSAKSEVNQYTDSQISSTKNEINLSVKNNYASKTELTNAVNGVHVGVTNLFRNSGFTSGVTGWESHDAGTTGAFIENSNNSKSGKVLLFNSTGGGVYQRNKNRAGETESFPKGTELTISGYFFSSSTSHLSVALEGSFGKNFTPSAANTWTRFEVSGVANGSSHTVTLYGANGNKYCLKELKLEKGNKATDWSPSPEDTDSMISSVKEYTDSQIRVAKGEISQSVTSTYETVTNTINGKVLFTDVTFKNGKNDVAPYNNANNGNTVVERINRLAGCPTTSTHCIRITHKGLGNPNLGGFVQMINSRANAVFIQKFVAKLPSGYSLHTAANETGSGRTDEWLTSNQGTGKWETYIRRIKCGASGTFSTTGFVHVMGSPTPTASNPMMWYLASCTAIDITESDDRVTDLTTRMSRAEQKITDSAIISTVSQTVNQAKQDAINAANSNTASKLQSYATNSQIEQLSNRITSTVSSIETVDGKVNSAQSQINQQAGQIASKVNTNDFASLVQQNGHSVMVSINNSRSSMGIGVDTSGLYGYNNGIATFRLTEGKFHAYNSTNGDHMGYFGTIGNDLRANLFGANTFSVYSDDRALLFRARYVRDASYGNATLDMCGGINFVHRPGQDVGLNQILLGNDDRSDAYGYHNMSIRCWNTLGFQDNYGWTNMFFDVRRGRIIMKGGLYQNTATPPRSFSMNFDGEDEVYNSGFKRSQAVDSIMGLRTGVHVDNDGACTSAIYGGFNDLITAEYQDEDGITTKHINMEALNASLVVTCQEQQRRLDEQQEMIEEQQEQIETLQNELAEIKEMLKNLKLK